MNMQKKSIDGLRAKAEETLKTRSARPDLEKIPSSEVVNIVHELEVHQIELELQNEELRQAQKDLEESRLKYFELFELAPVGYLTMNAMGIIKKANLTAALTLGEERSKLINSVFVHWVDENFRGTWLALLNRVRENRSPQSCELKLSRRKGVDGQYIQLEAINAGKDEDVMHVNLVDITERRQIEANQKKMEEELVRRNRFIETILDNLPIGLAVNYIDQGSVTYMNRKFEEVYGWPREEIGSIDQFF